MWHNLPLSFPFHSALFHLFHYIQLWINISTLGNSLIGSTKVEYTISDNLTILLLGIYTQKKWMHVSTTGIVLNVHRSNMSRRNVQKAKNWELRKGSSIVEWINVGIFTQWNTTIVYNNMDKFPMHSVRHKRVHSYYMILVI